jgi:hypothetical protein
MDDSEIKSQRFIALCIFGIVLFNFPVLALFNVPGTLLGIPILYAYIFIAWGILIGLLKLIADTSR